MDLRLGAGTRGGVEECDDGEGGAARWHETLTTRSEVAVEVEISVRAIRDPACGGYAWLLRTL